MKLEIRKTILLFVFLLIQGINPVYSFQSSGISAVKFGGAGGEAIRQVYCSGLGEYHLAGYFHNSADIGGLSLVAPDELHSAFVASVSQNQGEWLVGIGSVLGGTSPFLSNIFKTNSGDVFVSGTEFGGITIESDTLTNSNAFVISLNNDGELNWMKSAAPSSANVSTFNTIQTSDSKIIAVGGFYGTWSLGNKEHTGINRFFGTDLFLSRYSRELENEAFTLIEVSGGGQNVYLRETSNGDLLVWGEGNGNVRIDDFEIQATNLSGSLPNFFLALLGSDFIPKWGLSLGHKGVDHPRIIERSDGKYYFVASFRDEVVINGNQIAVLSPGEIVTYVTLINENGTTEWTRSLGEIAVYGLALGPQDEAVITTRLMRGPFRLGDYSADIESDRTVSLLALNSEGGFQDLVQIGHSLNSFLADDLNACSLSGEVVVAGSFTDAFIMDGVTLTSNGEYDIVVATVPFAFLTSLDESETLPSIIDELSIYPNPATDYVVIQSASVPRSNIDVFVYNALGEEMISRSVSLSEISSGFTLSVSHLPQGVYLVRVGDVKAVFMIRR